jgi:hypothetical protein
MPDVKSLSDDSESTVLSSGPEIILLCLAEMSTLWVPSPNRKKPHIPLN